MTQGWQPQHLHSGILVSGQRLCSELLAELLPVPSCLMRRDRPTTVSAGWGGGGGRGGRAVHVDQADPTLGRLTAPLFS